MVAPSPAPKSGILEISPYVPGKAKAEGVAHPIKLSANENILGCSPLAREAFIAAADHLAAYPDAAPARCVKPWPNATALSLSG